MARKLLKVLGGGVGVLGVLLLGVFFTTFGRNLPTEDGMETGRVRVVMDGFSGIFVLDGGGGQVALVDAGNDAAGAKVLAELSRRGLDASAVKAVFLTHGHGDHVAATSRFPNAKVYAHTTEVELAEGRVAAKGPVPRFMKHSFQVKVTDTLEDGASVQVGALTVRAFHVPGHTSGSMAYLADGVLFFGDSAIGQRGGKMDGAAWIFSDDTDTNRASLKKLFQRLEAEKQEVRYLAFAHSGGLQGVDPFRQFVVAQP